VPTVSGSRRFGRGSACQCCSVGQVWWVGRLPHKLLEGSGTVFQVVVSTMLCRKRMKWDVHDGEQRDEEIFRARKNGNETKGG